MIGKNPITVGALILALILYIPLVSKQEESKSRHSAEAIERAGLNLIEIRRDIHQYPEVSGQEERTARLVAEKLSSLGLEVETGIGGHGVIGVLHGGTPGSVVAYRADKDAVLQVTHLILYHSDVKHQVSDICAGHEFHRRSGTFTVTLEILPSVSTCIFTSGTVKFIFQPSAVKYVKGALPMHS